MCAESELSQHDKLWIRITGIYDRCFMKQFLQFQTNSDHHFALISDSMFAIKNN